MKSVLYIIFILIIVVFFALVSYEPNEVTPQVQDTELQAVQVLEEEVTIMSEITESQLVEEKQEIVMVEEEAEVVVEQTAPVKPVPEVAEEPAQEVVVEEVPQISFTTINEVTREALVNIFCTTKSGGLFKPVTGSGVVIDERGIILTNAHVAQYFLIEDYVTEDFINCVIRTGSPAKPLYTAKPLFISPSWVKANANGIIQQEPKGTGEDDYALLLITGRTDPTKTIPDKFSFIKPFYDSGSITKGDNVLLAGYPAGFLSGIAISKSLYISSSVTQVMEVFTFKEGTLDLFSIGGSVVAQQGSSGGAVVNDRNELTGIIVTSSVAETTGERDLRAIAIGHINRSFVKDTGFNLQALFSSDVSAQADIFNESLAPALTQLLENELNKR